MFYSCKTYNDFDTFIYKYGDSSVPPKYHRSYTFTVNENSINLVVNSYGDVLRDTTVYISKSQFQDIKNLVLKADLKKKNSLENNGCTGGTSREIIIIKNDEIIFTAYNYFCGSKIYGNLSGDTEEIVLKLKQFFSNFSEILK